MGKYLSMQKYALKKFDFLNRHVTKKNVVLT
jgi:hypothetical protein